MTSKCENKEKSIISGVIKRIRGRCELEAHFMSLTQERMSGGEKCNYVLSVVIIIIR